MKKFLFFAVIGILFTAPAIAQTTLSDDDVYKARVAECKTSGCLVNLAVIYKELYEAHRYLDDLNSDKFDKSGEYLALWKKRGQRILWELQAIIRDPEIFRMQEDGRWEKMSEKEKQEWVKKYQPKDEQEDAQ